MNLNKNNQQILIVDDTIKNLQVLGTILKNEGYQISVAQDGRRALDSVAADTPDLILLDVMMPELDGYETCQCLKSSEKTRNIPVIFLTAKVEHEEIVKGFDHGAVDYVTKPFNSMELLKRVDTHLKIRSLQRQLQRKNASLAQELQVAQKLFEEACERIDGPLLGSGETICKLRESIESIGYNSDPVLLIGSPGSGEEAVARAIHRKSCRHQPAFIYVNCRQYKWESPEELFDVNPTSDHESTTSVYSLFQLADGGTLYLEAVNELTDSLQRQLADAIQELTDRRTTGKYTSPDIRIVAFIPWDLTVTPKVSLFSTRLYSILMEQIITIPRLDQRLEDIPDLVDHYIDKYAKRIGKNVDRLSTESLQRIQDYGWPGNIRELQNVLEHALAVSTRQIIEISEDLLEEGQRIDRYRLLDKLGEGGMGEVWKAKHQMLARPVAIKLIRAAKLIKKSERDLASKRFEREAQSISKLQSPNTIRLFDYGVTGTGEFYYVMELLSGMDLDSMINRFGPLNPERVVMFLRQVCHSLSEAHNAGIIHRDVKLQNLFVCKLGSEYDFLKVLDFGIAKISKEEEDTEITKNGIAPGSPITMAPEIISSSTSFDVRSDIYSLGCVAYKILTGKHVFNAKNSMEMFKHHLRSEPIPPSSVIDVEIPTDLEKIILQCLEKAPENRPKSMTVLRELLGNIVFATPWTQARAQKWWNNVPLVDAPGNQRSKKSGLHLETTETTKTNPW